MSDTSSSTAQSTVRGHSISAACWAAAENSCENIPSRRGAPRAILKAVDLCATDPTRAAQRLVEGGFTPRYDYARQALSELPYDKWREFDPEDTVRFWALRLHEAGLIKSDPKKIIADGADWRFLDELKRELKA
jgi:NitT/TauT family transport system substrate-binding protein